MYGIIYVITNTVNGKQYVGKTVEGLIRRWARHISYAIHGHTNMLIHRAIRKYGKESFIIEAIATANSHLELVALEKTLINRYKTLVPAGYNLTAGGEGCPFLCR